MHSLKRLKESFARVYDGANELQRELDLEKEAQRLNIPLETYRNFYQHRADEDIDPYPRSNNWWEMPHDRANWFIYLPRKKKQFLLRKGVFKLVGSSIIIAGVVALGQYFWEIPARKKQVHYQAWEMLNSAAGQAGSAGRIDALQDLNRDHIDLNGLDATHGNLNGIDLKRAKLNQVNLEGTTLLGAYLQGASFRGSILKDADLYMANLKKADMGPFFYGWEKSKENNDISAIMLPTNLEKANLRGANLEGANLDRANLTGALLNTAFSKYAPDNPGKIEKPQETNLKHAELKNANLQNANLQGANLEGAHFSEETNLQGADFRGAKNLTVEQVKVAQNWEEARYDLDFSKQLGVGLTKVPSGAIRLGS